MQEKLAKVGALSKEMDEIKKKDEKMTEDFESKLAEQNREIEDLLKKVEALESQ